MRNGQMVLLSCQINPSGFSGERIFRLRLADGSIHVGASPAEYCRTSPDRPIGPAEPVRGQAIDGFIEAMVISNGGDKALVAVPDGETVQVNMTTIPYEVRQSRESPYVPVGS